MTKVDAVFGAEYVGSPETYFGASRNEFLANGKPGDIGVKTFTIPETTLLNKLYLGGSWDVELEQAITAGPEETISFTYAANDLYFVASAPETVVVEVLRDGKPLGNAAGADITPGTSSVSIKQDRLYKLIHDTTPGTHTILMKIHGKGLKAYTFTFG
jgi:hypothetical protein